MDKDERFVYEQPGDVELLNPEDKPADEPAAPAEGEQAGND